MAGTATHVDRNDFARLASLVVVISGRAIEQALDLKEDHPTAADVTHYADEVRKVLALLEGK